MCSKRTGRGFLLSPSPLPLKTLVRSAPGRFDTQRRGGGQSARGAASSRPRAPSSGPSAAGAGASTRRAVGRRRGLRSLPDRVPTGRPAVFHNS